MLVKMKLLSRVYYCIGPRIRSKIYSTKERWERRSTPEINVTSSSTPTPTPTPTDQMKDENFSDVPTSSNCSENDFVESVLLLQTDPNACATTHPNATSHQENTQVSYLVPNH